MVDRLPDMPRRSRTRLVAALLLVAGLVVGGALAYIALEPRACVVTTALRFAAG